LTPSLADGTDFGELRVDDASPIAPSTKDNTFTITNSGTANLIISGVTTTGSHQADFTVIAMPDASVSPGG
jgi:hypothetical protein